MLLSLLFQLAVAAPPAATVVVVRHAEKASLVDRDPTLSAAGWARAAALDSVLADAGVTTVLITPFRRTVETASAVIARFGVTPMILPVEGDDIAAHAARVATVAKAQGGVVLVVGHSNTVGLIVAALGGPAVGDLCDGNHDQLFVVTQSATGAHVMRTRYGREDPPEARSCR